MSNWNFASNVATWTSNSLSNYAPSNEMSNWNFASNVATWTSNNFSNYAPSNAMSNWNFASNVVIWASNNFSNYAPSNAMSNWDFASNVAVWSSNVIMDIYSQAWQSISNLQAFTSNTSNMWAALSLSNCCSNTNDAFASNTSVWSSNAIMDIYSQAWTSISNMQTLTSNTSNMWSALTYSNLLSLSNILNGGGTFSTSNYAESNGQSNWNFASNLAVSTSNELSNMFGAPVVVSNIKSLSAQSIPPLTWTKITQFNATANTDTSMGAWDASAGVFTCKKPGYYRASMQFHSSNLTWTTNWWGVVEMRVNNVYRARHETLFYPSWSGANINLGPVQSVLYLAVGNTVDFHVYHTFGSSIPTSGFSVMSIHEIR
jgi:hypothetical protein